MGQNSRFTKPVKRLLRERAGGLCANPDCRMVTLGPATEPNKTVNIGEAAHITAVSPDEARYNADLSDEQRRAYDNGIWLCRSCHGKVDKDEQRYFIALLQEWKKQAERWAAGNSGH